MEQGLSDKDILLQFRNGQPHEAFEILVRTYQERLYASIRRQVANHADADDVLQNTFLNAWRGLPNFRGDSALFTWLFRIAQNEVMALHRKESRGWKIEISEPAGEKHAQTNHQEGPSSSEIEEKLNNALMRLPDKQRKVFEWRYYDELSYEEISQLTGTSVGALKASYFHAVKKIENHLTGI